jgi:hypothetical protein
MVVGLFQQYFNVDIDDRERKTYSQYLVDQFS